MLDLAPATPKAEIIERNAASSAYREARLAEAGNALPDEIVAADIEWDEHKRRIEPIMPQPESSLLTRMSSFPSHDRLP